MNNDYSLSKEDLEDKLLELKRLIDQSKQIQKDFQTTLSPSMMERPYPSHE